MTTPSPPPPPPEETASPRVAIVMQELRSAVRQRLGELATLLTGGDAARAKLAELKAREFVREPAAFSHRPGLGRIIVFVRKAVYHGFLKWFTRPVIEQQNSFNQASTALAQDLLTAHDDLRREIQQLHARVAQLERRLQSAEAPAAPIEPRP